MVSFIFLVFMASFVSVLNSERIEYDTEFESSRSSALSSSSSFVEKDSFKNQNFENGEFFYSSYEGSGEALSSFSTFVSDSNTYEGGCGLTRPPNIIICGPDEEFNSCVNGGCGRWNCSQPGIICIDLIEGACIPGCRCKKPLLRTDSGKCVPSDKCPPQCGFNEEYVQCKDTVCRPKSCTDLRFPLPCRQSISDGTEKTTCEQGPGCVCKEGYVRDDTGSCIPDYQCPPNITCGPDEEFDGCVNGGCGRWNCSQPGVICIDLIEGACKPGCRCKEPLLRTDDGKCVPSNQCPSPCGVNEEYVDNPVCRPQTCSDLGFPLPCQKDEASNQGPGCVCMEGYVRDVYGNCISTKECPSCGGDTNATSGCGTFCTTCDNYGQDVACILSCELNGCACKEGFVYDEKSKKCVLPENCPPKTCNQPNEILGCKNQCGTLRCDTRFKMLFKCPPPPKDCELGCVCKPGYYKTNDGRCVTKEECRACKPGCRCKKPLLRTDNGECVPRDQCPPVNCPGENTVYACPKDCVPQVCESIGKQFHCSRIKTSQNCTKECRCKDGFYKNKIGECISEKQCLQCNGPNEYFSCGKECDNVCATLNVQNQTNCPYDNIVCNPMCYCEEGYARDANNTCIPIENCPVRCGINEEYVDKPVCRPETCSDLGFPLPCMKVGAEKTSNQGPGCVCMEGYVRDANGSCISNKDCPSCGGDPNATTGCGTFCTTCDNYGQDVACILSCQLNGCDCKKGFIYDRKSKKCVLPENCPPKTCNKPNEIQGCKNACPPRTCEAKDRAYNCLPQAQVCYPDCVCKPGFYRNKNGDCVTKEQCSAKTCNKPNEIQGCKNACPPRTCEAKDRVYKCLPRPQVCLSECVCKPGFYRNKNGDCVTKEQCSAPKCTGKNEVLERAVTCPPQTCESILALYKCPERNASLSNTFECRCKPGYYRNKLNECISREECDQCRGPNEFFSCGGACDNVCATLKIQNQTNCPIINVKCNPMCYCEKGYARDANNICIPIEECPAPKTCNKPNEIQGCKNACPPRTCEAKDRAYNCLPQAQVCYPDCVCKPGFYRNKNGDCVTKEQCSAKTCNKPNEIQGCKNACPPRTCEAKDRVYKCLPRPQVCLSECVCKPGFYRNKNGDCVTKEQCSAPKCTGKNEVLERAVTCPPQTCESILALYKCPERNASLSNTFECRCKPGYYRNKLNECISREECDQCRGPNEFFSCGGACDNVCATLKIQNQTNCPIINVKCNPMCYCEKGYARDANNICIPIEECPAQCGVNEEYVDNPFCRPETCSDLGFPLPCMKVGAEKTSNQGPGCVCMEGYVRDANGSCISNKDCPSCGGDPNATTGCGTFCTTCDNYGQDVACILSCQLNGCDCKKGFIYDRKSKKCVLPENCPPKTCNKPNEIQGCKNACPPRTCEAKDRAYNCLPQAQVCYPDCVCKPGFYRNKNGDCVTKEQCSPKTCNQPNEILGCKNQCGTLRCDTRFKMLFKCPPPPKDCELGCVCKPGYYKTNDGRCVTKEECPPNIICGPDEEYDDCVNGGCGRWNCSQSTDICIRLIEGACKPGCRCKKPLLRTDNGECVPRDQCPPVNCPGENTVYACPKDCVPQVCESIGKQFHCSRIKTSQNCTKECRCKDGFYKNKIGECISEKQCLQCNGPNEYFSCGKECDNVCATLNVQNQTNCPYDNIVCNPMCYCEEGYARDANNTCIPIENCPVQCGINEEYVDKPVCRPETCSDLGFPLLCMKVGAEKTSNQGPGCVCMEGYVRDANGSCISNKDCPSCGGDPNATTGCGTFCTTCDNYGQDVACILSCQLNGCDCKKGFIYDRKSKKCVLPENCPPKTCNKPNEIQGCKNACPPRTCEAKDRAYNCLPQAQVCYPDCVCKPGFYRNKNGDCVTKEQCSAKTCNKPNEIQGCKNACPPRTCEAKDRVYKCLPRPQVCLSECVCKPGFYRNKNGDCVTKEQCSAPKCTGKNEVLERAVTCPPQTCESILALYKCPERNASLSNTFECRCKPGYYRNKLNECISREECDQCRGPNEFFSCGGACDNVCATLKIQNQTNCPIINVKCNPMCYCEKGYARDANNICIPIEECPAQCGVNEEYVDNPVCRPETCSDLGFPLPCMKVGAEKTSNQGPGCVCMEGYVRDAKGNCVSAKECPSCGGDPNATTGCGTFCKTCDNYGQNVACKLLCKLNGCDCKEGFVYDKMNKRCVLPENCPAPKCTGKNEVYELAVACPPQTCESIYARYNCAAMNMTSPKKYECRCKSGYLRNKNNECITVEECQKCRGPHEFFSCGGACDNVCATLKIQNQTKCPIRNIKCNPMCYCEKGYARDANNNCIPIEDCPVQCKKNEEFVECPDTLCRPTKCTDVGFPIACPSLSQCPSKPGCVCSAGYVKNENGACIPAKDCPSCGGDKNAVVGCGVNCNRKCFGNTKICPRICKFNSCDCKPGFLFDSNVNKCVLPRQCTAACGPNETYSTCTNRACHRNNCSQLSIPWVCRPIAINSSTPDPSCRGGCECISGYLRNNNNTCIPQEQCPEATNNTPSPSTCNTDDEEGQLVDGNSIFTSKFLYYEAKNNPGTSLVGSPCSVLFLLAQLALFTTGVAAEQLYALLNLKNPKQIRGTIPPFLNSFNSEKNITLALAEKVFGSENYPFSERFKDVTKNLFKSEAQNLDFSKPAEAAKVINDWVASKTNNLIQNLVPADSLNANTRLVLANAIYFKGNWSKIFKKSNTKSKDFYVSDSKTVKVEMMNQMNSFRYGVTPESNSQVVELPYINENCTFLVLLPPKTSDGLSNLLKEQLNVSFIKSVIGKLKSTKVNLSLPAFKTETSIDLQDILMKSNVTEIFNAQGSGLSGILAKPEKLYVSSALQKASVIVTETGTEAAAANAIIVGLTAVAPVQHPVVFNADHSFIYYILLKGNPIFCGLYAGPQ